MQGGFTRCTAMAEAQPGRCFLDYHTVITKLIKKLGEIVWHLIRTGVCRLYHFFAIFKALIIHWEPHKTEELPLNLTNPL